MGERFSNKWFESVLDAMHDMVLVKGPRSRLLWANRAFCEYYGLSNQQLESLVDAEHSDPDDTLQYVRDDHQVWSTGQTLHVVEPVTRADGDVSYFDTTKTAVRSDGETVLTVGVSRRAKNQPDIAQSQTLRDERKESSTILRSIVSSLPAPVAVLDAKARIVEASRAFNELVGAGDGLIEQYITDVLPLPPDVLSALEKAAGDGDETAFSNIAVTFAGEPHFLDLRLTPWRLSSDQAVGALLKIIDVTELRATERRLAQVNQELEEFAYVASHDLQEPLRMVRSYVDLLREEYGPQLDDEAKEYMHFAVDGAERMQRLVRDLLYLSRTRKVDFARDEVSLDKVVAEAVSDLQVLQHESGATVKVGPLPNVLGDAVQLGQLFRNLIGNAFKFTAEGEHPSVEIIAREESDFVRVEVRDQGIGMDTRFSQKAFQMFQRLHPVGTYPGTGIGLAVCKRIVTRHGGTIGVDSAPGEGAVFWFTLPRRAS